jgi:3-methylcrotonyl-CoA carboxylase alpha subunit
VSRITLPTRPCHSTGHKASLKVDVALDENAACTPFDLQAVSLMLKKILIANRGEIACRIARTADKMGIATVAVYSDADAGALHVDACDDAIHIGASPATESYLRVDKIIAAAKASGADAIHPGYGFLSENADLPEACAKAGIIFIGPTAKAMRALGGKAAAKDIAIKAGVPVVPGYQGEKQDVKSLAKEAARIGYPVMIKAVAGGGGRGMRLVESEAHLAEMLESAQREAQSSFGNPLVLVEKVVVRPRHIEVQVFGDTHGNVVHMFERDCTLQRRNQKVIEEAPAPGMSAGLREAMCGAAVKLAKHVGYTGAGTVEFLVEGGTLDETAKWYFIEMNTRLQVEHPVTEEITGLDLVEWQFRVAAGEKLPLRQADVVMSGHAIEVRLCAEDPANGFMPSVGKIEHFSAPSVSDVRVETGVRSVSSVSPFYDSMIAKLIVHRSSRAAALTDLGAATLNTRVVGPRTNQTFLARLLLDQGVRAGTMDTGLIGRTLEHLASQPDALFALTAGIPHWLLAKADAARAETNHGGNARWSNLDAFQLGPPRVQSIAVQVGEISTVVEIDWKQRIPALRLDAAPVGDALGHDLFLHHSEPGTLHVLFNGTQTTITSPSYDASEIDSVAATGAIKAPINGRVSKVFVTVGAKVAKGDRIAIVEAMKMEHVIAAKVDGTIDQVAAVEGAQINQGAMIAHIAA